MKCTITIQDEVFSYVTGLKREHREYITEKMSKYVEGYRFMPKFVYGGWDGRMPFFHNDGKIYTRLLDDIFPWIEAWDYEIDFDDRRKIINIVDQRIDKDWFKRKSSELSWVELRPYQVEAINACLENRSGFIVAATGAGKCLSANTMIEVMWLGLPYQMTYSQLFKKLELEGYTFEIDRPVDISLEGVQFPTPTGLKNAVAAVVKMDVEYHVIVFNHATGLPHRVECAAGHNFINADGNEVRADDLVEDQMIQTEFGLMPVVSVFNTGRVEQFYDVSIDSPEHVYYDAYGILHHNTWMVAGLADILNLNDINALVIVPSDDLVQQTVKTLQEAQVDTGVYSGTKKDIYHGTVVATWQALQNNPTLVRQFKAIIVDEAHGAKARVVGDLINIAGGDSAYRFGFTGTMPKPEIDLLTLRGSIGDVLFSITAAELMAMGYLAELFIEPVEITEKVTEDFPDYASEKTYLSRCDDRLDLLADLAIDRTARYGNTLILVNSVKQGKALQKKIKGSVFLHGVDDTATRQSWYALFESRNDLIVIATFGIASTGLSIDRIFHLMLIDAGKSFTRAIQSVGRGLRMGGGKTKVYVTDVYSTLKFSKRHFNERKKFYKEAQYNTGKPVKFRVE